MRIVIMLFALLAAISVFRWVSRGAYARGQVAWWVRGLVRGAAIGIIVYVVLTLGALLFWVFFVMH